MKSIRSSDYESVLEDMKKTYPNYKLCSHDDLGRITGGLEITNPSRFWNERCHEILSAIQDINVILHRYPDSYKMKLITSPEFDSLFHSQVFTFLEEKIRDTKNPNPEATTIMIKLCSNFLRLGLAGMMRIMPSEFIHILQPKYDEMMSLMESINSYTKRIAPKYAKSTEFPFDMWKDIS